MSTRGLIAIEDSDKKVRAIFVQSDMYVEYAGQILHEHYNSEEKAYALLALGSLSAIRERLSPESGETHNYDKPAQDICIAFHRDRGDQFSAPTVFENAKTMQKNILGEYWASYCYLYRNNQWYVSSVNDYSWTPITQALKECNPC